MNIARLGFVFSCCQISGRPLSVQISCIFEIHLELMEGVDLRFNNPDYTFEN